VTTTEIEAANMLATEHLALVGYLVNDTLRRVPSHISRDDLTSAANLALVRASRDFDSTLGVPFGSYASMRIRGALLDALRQMDFMPRGSRQRARNYQEARNTLTAVLERNPSRQELADDLHTDLAGVDRASADADMRLMSVDDYTNSIGGLVQGGDGPMESLLAKERATYLAAAIHSLPGNLRSVIEGLFLEGRTITELADERGVTQSRISQLRTEALALMKDGMNASLEPCMVPVSDRPGGVAERRRRQYFASVASRASLAASATAFATLTASPVAPKKATRHLHSVENIAA
jgi:RNA polymerase sigma factor FliA